MVLGVGKSTLCQYLCETKGLKVLEENFKQIPLCGLHPNGLIPEARWVVEWMYRVLECIKCSDGEDMIFVDRSPYSAVIYGKDKVVLRQMVDAALSQLRDEVGVDIMVVRLMLSEEELWQRISNRLSDETERSVYNERSFAWMKKIVDAYDDFPWECSLNVDGLSVEDVAKRIFEVMNDDVE